MTDLVVKMVEDSRREKEHMGFSGEASKGRSEMEAGAKLCMALQAAVRSLIYFVNTIERH